MKLKVFTKEDGLTRNIGLRTVAISTKNCSCTLSVSLTDNSAKNFGYALLALNESSNEWYIAFGNFDNGFKLREKKNLKGNSQLYFHCGNVAKIFLEKNKIKTSCTCLVSENQIDIDGTKWYKIVNSKPIRKS